MKKRFFIAVCAISVFSSVFSVSARTNEEFETQTAKTKLEYSNIGITPFFQNVVSVHVGLTFNNSGRGTLAGSILAQPGTTITVDAVLERVNANGTFTHIQSWDNMRSTNNTWAWERTYNVARGHEYRLTFTITAVRNGVSETITESRTARAS